MGIKSLRKLQLGMESSPGAHVPATTLWRGMGVLKDDQELQFVEEDVGVLSQPDSAYISKLYAGLEFEEVDCTFEQLPYILSAGIKGVVVGVRDGALKDPYIYEYPMPMATANTIQAYTVEGGDDAGAEMVNYAFVQELGMSGAAGEAVKMSATWGGRVATPHAYTGSITIPSTEVALFNKGRFYIDEPLTGNFGVTRKTDTLLAFELNVNTGWLPRYTCDEELYFRFLRATRPEVTLSLTMEHNTTSIDEKAALRLGKARLIRLVFEGSAFTTPGDTYTKRTIIIDCVGKYRNVPSLDDEDGDNVLGFELGGIYLDDAEFGPPARDGYMKITVVNALPQLP